MSKYFDFMHIHSNYTETLLKLGVSPSKIVIAIEFMVRRSLSYYEICDLLSNETAKWIKSWDSSIGSAITSHETANGQWKSFIIPSSRSIAKQIRDVVRQDLAGAMAYTIDSDDSIGKCKTDDDTFNDFNPEKNIVLNIPERNDKSFPLLKTINDAFIVAIDEINQEKILH